MKFRSFRYLFVEGLKNVWSHRLMSVASVGVLVACMLMMGLAWSISINISSMVDTLENQNVIMVFFKEDLSREAAQAASDKLTLVDNIQSSVFVSKEDGLERQKEIMGEDYAPLFDWVEGENPLPDGAQVTLTDLSLYDQTIDQLKQVDGVDYISDQRDVAVKLTAIRSIINNAGFWIIVLLMIISLVIVSNTIKVTMFTRKLEINIMKAVGATNGFIRLPFIIEGITLGIFAGVLSTGLLYFLYKAAEKTFLTNFSAQFIPFTDFAWPLLGIFIGIGIAVGALGSAFSLGKYLRKEGSEFNEIA